MNKFNKDINNIILKYGKIKLDVEYIIYMLTNLIDHQDRYLNYFNIYVMDTLCRHNRIDLSYLFNGQKKEYNFDIYHDIMYITDNRKIINTDITSLTIKLIKTTYNNVIITYETTINTPDNYGYFTIHDINNGLKDIFSELELYKINPNETIKTCKLLEHKNGNIIIKFDLGLNKI